MKVIAVRVVINVAGLAAVNLDIGTSECGTSVPPTPAITSISPTQGSEAGATSVTINGSGFLGTTAVNFGSTPATSYTIDALNKITAVAPAGTGTVDVRVVNPTGTSANTASDDYKYVPKPVITAVTPIRGPTAGGTTVTITGTNLSGASAVTFGGTAATSFSVDSATQITAVAPAKTAGQVDVRVTTTGGQSDVVSADQYTYVAVPTVTAISPSVGQIGGGTTVTITGTALSNASVVKFGNTNGTSITANTATSLTVVAPAGSAGTVDVTVTTPGGTSANTTADDFTYVSTPTVTNVNPSSGSVSGGTSVTITGTGFAGLSGAAAVKFGGTNATSYTVNSTTSITAVSPAGSAGTIDVTVTNPAGTSPASAADQFTYIALPTVSSVSPATGPLGGGTSVTITGTGFTGATAVNFGANSASFVTVVSPTQITATSPAGTAGTADVRVVTPAGTSANTSADDFVYAAAPTVSGISPTAGPVAGGTSVVITGTNLTGATAVRFGGTDAASYTVNGPGTSITAVTPAGSAGPAVVTVVTPGGTVNTSGANRFTYTAAPVITGISPSQGAAAGGLGATITGTGFTGATSVKFDQTSVIPLVLSDTTITIVGVPAHAVGPVNVSVTTPNGGTSAATAASTYTYVGQPTLTSISPASGPTAGGNTVTLTGTGFTNVNVVNFGLLTPATFTVVSDTEIRATAPAVVGAQLRLVSVNSVAYGTSGTQPYQYVDAPTVTLLTPSTGPVAGGTTVTVAGSGFTGATQVLFDGVPGTNIAISTDSTLTVRSPAGTVGAADVTVVGIGGTSSALGTLNDFTYVAAPAITSLSPTSGSAASATSVTITGTGFSGTTGVSFGGTPAVFSQLTDTTITIPVVPLHDTGDVNVVVTTANGGSSAVTAATKFTYLGAPTLTAVSPNRGPAGGGNQVVLTGTGFNQAVSVSFGLTSTTSFTKNSDTQITLNAPPGVIGTVPVTVSAGGVNISNSENYTYAAAPTVLTVNPNQLATTGGTRTVTLTGTGFTGATDVKFGSVSGTSLAVSNDGSLTVLAPTGTPGTVAVTVVAPGGTSTPVPVINDFTFIGQPVVSSVTPNTGPLGGGTAVTITGSGFNTATGASAVKFGGTNATSYVVVNDTTITAITPANSAGAAAVTVTTALGGTSASGTVFTYLGAPAVTGISPAAGLPTGGTTVAITGAGFTPTSTVAFGLTQVSQADVTYNSPTSITVTSSPAGLGTVDVRVTTAGGTSPNTAADDFTYVGTPVVSGLSPTAGDAAGGQTVSITGTGFIGVLNVNFGATAATSFTRQSDTLITATVPAGSGVVNVRVTTLVGGTSAAAAANQYTYVGAPTVSNVSPDDGPVAGGTPVTITGTNFTNATGVRFGNVLGANPQVVNATTMTVTSPAGSAGTVPVTVVGVYANSAASSSAEFTYLDLPEVTGVSPDSGSSAGGTAVTISGTGFTSGSVVKFGATTATTGFQFISPTEVRVTSPAGAAGVVNVSVTTDGGVSSTTGTRDDFRYVGTPTISALAPTTGKTAGGDLVTITGGQFYDVTSVTFDGVAGTALNTTGSPTSITVRTPPHAAGPVSVLVNTTAGGVSAPATFTYVAAPSVGGVTPDDGVLGGGTSVTLTGSGFTGATQVNFGTVPATSFTVDSATQITATSPGMSMPGTFDVTVEGPYGTSATNTNAQFTYAGPPTVTGISPTRGALAGGTEVTITGTGFTAGTTVTFDGVAATVRFVSATQVVATTPAGNAGTVAMVLNNGSGSAPGVNFTYADLPAVTSVTPPQGRESGGTAVVVRGSGFSTATGVKFGPDTASFSIVSDTEITTTSPGGTGSVNVRVTNDIGTSQAVSANAFQYLPAPTVTGVTPASGPLSGTTTVTVNGTGFVAGATTVDFGSAPGTSVNVISPTRLTVISPSSATAQVVNVLVTTANGTSSGAGTANDFAYVAAPSVGGISPTAGPVAGGTVMTISGTGFADATTVRFGTVSVPFVVNTDGTITLTVPAGSAGLVDITVTGPGGTSAVTPNTRFRYQVVPAISGISPAQGAVTGGTAIVITGTGFTGATRVTVGGNDMASFTVDSDTSIRAVTPAGLIGDRPVRVTTPGGLSPASTFTYLAAPDVSAIDPSVGPIAGGTQVTITGTGLTGATSVSFGGTTATPTVNSDTSLTVTSPAHAAGTVDVTVTGPLGTSAATTSTRFRYVEPGAAPALSSVNPRRGPAAGGNTVTLNGLGFTGASAVTFGGQSALYTVVSDTEITVTVPENGDGTVTIRVTTANGTSTDELTYTYVPLSELPRVDSLSPNVGPVAGGTPLTITGARFDEQTTVTFDGIPGTNLTLGPDVGGSVLQQAVPSTIRAAYSETLTVTSPAHAAGLVTIAVTNAAGTTTFVQSFTFIPLPSAVAFPVEVPAGTTSVIAPRGPDYTDLVVDACSAPSRGTVVVGPKGQACLYTAPDEVGSDEFTMDITDVIGQSTTQTVEVTVVPGDGTGTGGEGGNNNGGDGDGTGTGGEGGNDTGGDNGTGTGGEGGNSSGEGDGSGSGSGTGSGGGNDGLAFTGTPYFLVPLIGLGFGLILVGSGLVSVDRLRNRSRRR
nr:IPT/TIG domain-containing protein [Kineosporia babensis]